MLATIQTSLKTPIHIETSLRNKARTFLYKSLLSTTVNMIKTIERDVVADRFPYTTAMLAHGNLLGRALRILIPGVPKLWIGEISVRIGEISRKWPLEKLLRSPDHHMATLDFTLKFKGTLHGFTKVTM